MYKMPAFIDSHCHFLGVGYVAFLHDLTKYDSINALIEGIKNQPHAQMVIGRGWNQEHFSEKRLLTKHDLNQISKELPVVMVRTCGHVLTVNDKMLEVAGIDSKTVWNGSGTMSYETGLFTEDALGLIYDHYPVPTKEDLIKYLVKANEIFLSHGITSVASDDFCVFPIPYEEVMEAILDCYRHELIQVRITEQANLPSLSLLEDFIHKGYANHRFGHYKMGPLKLLADGSLGGRTAYLREPYSDDPMNRGIRNFSDEELFQLIHLADSSGMDVAIHAIGDAAMDQVLNAIIKSLQITQRTDHHHAIIHAQMATHDHVALMKQYHIGAIVQPIFLNSDIEILDSRIGQRKDNAYLFHSMVKEGLVVGYSTDTPVESPSAIHNIYSAVTRKSLARPDLGVYLGQEKASVEEAILCSIEQNLVYTYETVQEDEITLSENPFKVRYENIKDIMVLTTRVNGQTVYKQI